MSNLNFMQFPILTTERLVLQKLSDKDSEALFKLRSDDRVNKYIDRYKKKNIKEVKELISKINNGIDECEWIYWAISLKDKSELIGTICLWNFSENCKSAEIGYELMPEYQGQGIMSEAVNCIMDFAFKTINLKILEAYTHKDNINSIKLLEKIGFKLNPYKVDEENKANVIYELDLLQKINGYE